MKDKNKTKDQLINELDELRRQVAVLEAVSFAAEQFLKAHPGEKRIQEMLNRVGKATEVSRVYIFENHTAKDGTLLTSQQYEWVAPGIEPQMGKSNLYDFPWQTGGMGRWEKNMSKGDIIQGHVRTFPKSEQEILYTQDIKSIVAVPIFVGQKWWGFIGFDECLAEREWSVIEIDTLRVVARTLSAAMQHKRADEVLQESEEKYKNLFESTLDGMFVLDAESMKIVLANQAIAKIYGFDSKEDAVGANPLDFVYPEDRDRVSRVIVEDMFEKDLRQIEEYRTITKDGREVWISAFGTRTEYHGRLAGLISVRDISESKRANALIRSQRDLGLALSDAVRLEEALELCLDAATRVSEMDCGGVYLVDEVTGNVDLVFHKGLTNDFVKSVSHYDADSDNARIVMAGNPIYNEYKKLDLPLDETKLHEELRVIAVVPVPFRDRVIGCLNIASHTLDEVPIFARNALETIATQIGRAIARAKAEGSLRESEERFRVLVEESPLGVSVIGKDGRYKYVNPKFIQIFGYTLENIPTGREWFKKAYPDKEYRNQVVSSWIDDLKDIKSGESRPQTFTVKCKDGSEKVIIFRPVTMKTGDQFVVYTDITERKRLESQLQQAQKMEAIGTLAGGIAHDFNNILTSVLGNISVAQMDTEPGGKIFELLTEAEKAAMRAKDLTARLITFSKGGDPFRQEVSIEEFVKESVNSMLEGSSIHCEFTIPDDLWAVNIDERQMKQVVHNIIINAMEVMKGKGEINVYCENVNVREKDVLALKAGKYARISIKDQGVGIPQKNLTKIFDPYFSTKEMGTQKGMGLGLAVCHSIVKKHDGLITVESHVNVGSTFHIYLPALSAESKEQRTEYNDVTAVEKPVVGKGKILVMDDEETVRGVTAAMLNKFGYEVEVAVEGSEAIEMYKKAKESGQSYDGVILDLTNKIGMGGLVAIKRLLEIDPEIKAIIATGYSTDPIVTKFKEYGFCGALAKPFTMDELRKTVKEVVGPSEIINNFE